MNNNSVCILVIGLIKLIKQNRKFAVQSGSSIFCSLKKHLKIFLHEVWGLDSILFHVLKH